MLLGIVVNQAGTERTFSDLKIKQTRLRNRVRLDKLEKMSKVNAFICTENSKAHAREHCKNHSSDTVTSLLRVPRYADILDLSGDTPEVIDDGSDLDTQRQNVFITTPGLWRKELAKWVEKERENGSDSEEQNQPITTRLRRSAATSLAKLFGGTTARPVTRPPRTTHSEEALLMELLEAEYEGEAPDDGALEGSGDDFDG